MHLQGAQGLRACGQHPISLRNAVPRSIHRSLPTPQAVLVADGLGTDQVVLPPSLKNNVVVLDAPNPEAPGGVTKVYLLAMSHVSKVSVQQVKDLVRAVKPEVVGVELCRDRLGLLADDTKDVVSNLLWHCRKIEIDGMPTADEWPRWTEMTPLLRSQPGRPITTQDIEADVITLLSTGLFRSVRPQCQNATYTEAPAFITAPPAAAGQDGDAAAAEGGLQTVPPLGCVRFAVQERSLPPITEMTVRVDSSLKAMENPEEQLQQVVANCMAANAAGREGGVLPSLTCLLIARQKIAALFTAPVVVSFLGVETGKVEVLVRCARDTDPAFTSGFEDSAQNGDGWGIEVFRPKKNLFKISDKMYLPQEVVDSLRAQARGILPGGTSATGSGSTGPALPPPKSQFRLWQHSEMDECKPPAFEGSAFADTLGAIMTGLYAKYQSQAARKLGLTAGSAWKAALEAANEVGAQQVMLIDRPTVVTERKLADALVAATGSRMGAAAGLVLSTLIAAIATDVLPPAVELGGFAGVVGVATLMLWPLVGPLRESAQLAEMTPEQIEDAVAVKQPIASGDLSQPLKLFGEDALLDWPGAMEPVIRDRDAYMAKALAAAATGADGIAPVFVRDDVDGQAVWRFMMPEGAPLVAAPQGLGDGACKSLTGVKAVVGIVGSAHVKGMVREWQPALSQPGDVEQLLKA